MALRRFWISAKDRDGENIHLEDELFHHVRDVCRFDVGDQFEVLTGDGHAYLSEIVSMGKKAADARILSRRQLPEPQKPYLHLALSVPKFPKVDWIVEKCVELGVKKITPFVSDYSFVRSLKDVSSNRLQRWEKLIIKATEQSGRGDVMALRPPCSLEALLEEFNRSPEVAGLFPYEGEAHDSWRQQIPELKGRALNEVWVFVGSEGGFSPKEVQMFTDYGLKPMTLGDQILRVETACVALMSVLKYELDG